MTKAQERKEIAELWDQLCTLACERREPPFKPYLTKLQGAALQLQRFATRCRDQLIDPLAALRQAVIIMREQPRRTQEDYNEEARRAAQEADSGGAVPGTNQSNQSAAVPHDTAGTGDGASNAGRVASSLRQTGA